MSQCAAILQVLADGKPHSYREIHARAGFMRLNSCVAELRSRGHDITCERVDGDYRYVLHGSPLDAVPDTPAQFREAGESGAASSGAPDPGTAHPSSPLRDPGERAGSHPHGAGSTEHHSPGSLSGVTLGDGDGNDAAQLTLIPEQPRRELWAA